MSSAGATGNFDSLTNGSAGVIAGSGTVSVGSGEGTLYNYGTLRPGGSNTVGTLSIQGDLSMESGSVLAVDIQCGDCSSDQVVVSGTAWFGPSLTVAAIGPSVAFVPPDIAVTYSPEQLSPRAHCSIS